MFIAGVAAVAAMVSYALLSGLVEVSGSCVFRRRRFIKVGRFYRHPSFGFSSFVLRCGRFIEVDQLHSYPLHSYPLHSYPLVIFPEGILKRIGTILLLSVPCYIQCANS